MESLLELVKALAKAMQEGGAWFLLAITMVAAAWQYREKEKQARWFFEQLIALSNEQTAAMIKAESTIDALKDLVTTLTQRRGP